MRIESIKLTNFRCFGHDPAVVTLEDAVTTFVGNNGSGKTAIFAALSKLFGVTQHQRTLFKRDFHVPAAEPELASGTTLVIECVIGFPELDPAGGVAQNDAVPDFFHHMSASGEGQPLKVRIRLHAVWNDDGTPDGSIEEDARWIRSLDDDFDFENCRKVQGSERGLIQLIYVPASRNASDQVTSLLKGRIWQAALWSKKLEDEAKDSAKRIQDEFDSELPALFVTERLERRWQQVHQGDTDALPMLRLIEGKLDDLLKKAEFVFFPDEAKRVARLEDLSDGQRSLFHIALTAATLEIERDALALDDDEQIFDVAKLRRVHLTILAIEEPENSLSPYFLSRIMTQAREVGGMEGAQVIVSSHSASILARTEAEEVRYCRMDAASRRSSVKNLTLPASDSEAGKFVRLAVKAYPELYFARFVILAEGDSEAIVLPRVAEAMGVPLDPSFVPVVPLGGRFVDHFWRLLTNLAIPYATILDLDLGRKHGGKKAIKYAVEQLASVGRTMATNPLVLNGTIDTSDIDDIDDEELLDQDQKHPWIKALRREAVFFSSPIDLDFAMAALFSDAYRKSRPGGKGPRKSAKAIEEKKKTTLKTGGNINLYDEDWDDHFIWYPYLFLSESKPETHIRALSDIANLAENAPPEISKLVKLVRRTLFP